MAKKQVPEKRKRTPKKKNKAQNKNKGKTKISTATNTKTRNENKNRKKITHTDNNDASSEETEVLVAPSSSMESENDDVVESDGDVIERRSSGDEEEEEERETLKSIKERGKKDVMKGKGKKRSREEEDEDEDESDAKDKGKNLLYRFPMNRVSRIIKSDNPDFKILQEALFVINKASEKFLEAFCSEAYTCACLDKKKHTAYEHLSTIVSRQKRLNFLSDFIPEKVKAEDALARLAEAEKRP